MMRPVPNQPQINMTSTIRRPAQPIRFHSVALSGHCHRVALLLSMLDLPHETLSVNLAAGEHKQAAFLAMNAFGQVPVIEDGDRVIADSNAILVYLATEYGGAAWLPANAIEAAEQQRWFAQAAGPLAFGAAAARVHKLFKTPLDLPLAHARAHQLLRVMDGHLATRDFLLGARVTLADLAHYAYTARAPEGEVLLDDYGNVRRWLARIESLPGFVPMPVSA